MALMKAVRGAEISLDTLNMPKFAEATRTMPCGRFCKTQRTSACSPSTRLMKRGVTAREIHDVTMIDMWFLEKLNNLLDV